MPLYGTTPDATTSTKGKIQLAGDLGGTAAAPTIGNAKITPDKLANSTGIAAVNTSETTTSTSYTDLTTTTDTVTVTIGANGKALVSLFASMTNNTLNAYALVGVDVSGASTIAAADTSAIGYGGLPVSELLLGGTIPFSGLTPGSTTFKMKYRVTGGTGTFKNRKISALPL